MFTENVELRKLCYATDGWGGKRVAFIKVAVSDLEGKVDYDKEKHYIAVTIPTDQLQVLPKLGLTNPVHAAGTWLTVMKYDELENQLYQLDRLPSHRHQK